MILSEFDFDKEAIISPWNFVEKLEGMPKVAVTCFFHKSFERMIECLKAEQIAETSNANGKFPVYKVRYKNKDIALFMIDMGAAGAAGQLEETFALGIEKVVVFGSCGVLDKSIEDMAIIVPDMAVRDEGLSYHYLPASDEMQVNPKYIPEFTSLLDEVKCPYIIGKTWTTDGFYRETRAKMEKRKEQGCICVEMECSALSAVAQFRGKELFQFLHAADNLDGEEWDRRSLGEGDELEGMDMFSQLALELAVRISD
ncbi:MAG: nucleoside phosphorylase [Lachnospiraceae bacterium]|nr:nucleoside phosphorylase [Lachnospiraceae bacterium]